MKPTPAELRVLQLYAYGLRTETVAKALGISEWTVRTHSQGVLLAMGCHSRSHAVAVAMRRGWIH